jgi:Tfp pilus assembly protein PilN
MPHVGIAVVAIAAGVTARVIGQLAPSTSDPFGLVSQLGIAGLIGVVLWLWQRDTAKSRDKAVDQLTQQIAGLNELKSAVDRSTEAHKAATQAMSQMIELLKERPPSRALINRLEEAVDRIEAMNR